MIKIIVAEDDDVLGIAYKAKLSRAGFDLRLVGDGDEAIKTLAEFIPDIILLDLIMPIKDGFTALKEIKENSLWKDIPIIVASNLGQPEDIDRAMKLGAADYIIKSDFAFESLIEKINSVVSQHNVN